MDELRRRIMQGNRSQNTRPEIYVRKLLHSLGYRFRLHQRDLPGNPDIVLPKFKTVIFVNGCFWHRHANCKVAGDITKRSEKWQQKLQRNVERDLWAKSELEAVGWKVIVIWECELKNNLQLTAQLRSMLTKIN